jgi:hypothetical protein
MSGKPLGIGLLGCGVLIALASVGCGEPRYDAYKPVSAATLAEMVDHSSRDAVAMWCYDSSDDRWHYFNRLYYPLSFFQAFFYASAFRVPRDQMEMPKVFPRNEYPRTASACRGVFYRSFDATNPSGEPGPQQFPFDFNARDPQD